MRKLRRITTMILALALFLTGITIPETQGRAEAEGTATGPSGIPGGSDVGVAPDALLQSGEWLFYLDGEDAIIAGYANKAESALTIPYSLGGHTVSGIGGDAFADMASLDAVTVHSLVNRIAPTAFRGTGAAVVAYSGGYALQYARANGLRARNRTNQGGMYEVNASVVDFSGFPKREYYANPDHSIRVSTRIARLLKPGDVVYLPDKSSDYHLYAYEIAGLEAGERYTTIQTRDVDSIGQFLDGMSFADQELWLDLDNIVMLNEGVTLDDVNGATVFKAGFDNTASFTLGIPLGGAEGFRVEGGVSFAISGSASIDVKTVPSPSIKSANIGLSTNLGYTITVKGQVKASEKKVNLFKVPVRGGPFSFWFTVSLSVSLTGTVTITGGFSGSIAFVKEAKKNWKLVPSFSRKEPGVELSVKVAVALPVEASAELGVEIGSVGLALKFVSFKISPALEATGKTVYNPITPLQCVDVTVAGNVTISAAVGCLEVILGKHKWKDLAKFELSTKLTLFSISFHLDNTAQGIHYQKVDTCRVRGRTVLFKKKNGQNDIQMGADAGQIISEPPTPSKEGQTFGGWYFSPSQSGESGRDYKWNFRKFRLPYLNNLGSNYVFYAKWLAPGEEPEPDLEDQPQGTIYGGLGGYSWFFEPPKPVEVESITLNHTTEVLHVDGEYKDKAYLYAVVLPANADDASVTWSSSNPSVATVDNGGVVSALKQGETTITCKSNMVPSVTATCKVNVFEPVYVKSITLDKTNEELWANEGESGTLQLNATVLPADATYSSVHWSSSDEEVAWVDGWGKVTALAPGKATISCISVKNQDVVSTCEVTVHQRVRDVYIASDSDGLLPTETAKLSALCYPTSADNQHVLWSSSDDSVATVNENGEVTAVGYGQAIITASTVDGGNAAGAYTVNVERELSLIADIQNDSLYLEGQGGALIGYAYATQSSVRRMLQKGYALEWSLLDAEGEVADAYFDIIPTAYTVDGESHDVGSAVLYSGALHRAGSESFTLKCTAGPYTATVDLAASVSGDRLAKSVSLSPSTYALSVGEVLRIPNAPVATDGGAVPQILSVSMSGDEYYRNHVHENSDAQGRWVSFPESGQYSASVVYRAANASYTVPVTFEVRDENGVMRLPVTAVALDASYENLVVGQTLRLSAEVAPADASDPGVTWSSDDESIATVSADGLVTAVGQGMAYIRCEAKDGSGCYDSCMVNVEPFVALNEAAIERTVYMDGETNVAIDSCSLTYLSAVRLAENGLAPNWTLSRLSGDATEIALSEYTGTAGGDVSVEGEELMLLRVNHAGTDRFRLTCEAGGTSAACEITLNVVEGGSLPESIALATGLYEAEIGETIAIDTAISCLPEGATLPEDATLTLEPSRGFWNAMEEDTYFADFNCTFAQAGEYAAELVVSGANYRYAAPFVVRVRDENGAVPVAIQSIGLSDESVELFVGDSHPLSASVLPADAACGALTWSSFDTSVATVSGEGVVTAVGAGTTYIIAGFGYSDETAVCLVTVEDGLTMAEETLNKTVFVDGATRTPLDTAYLTGASSRRLDAAPQWRLQRVSGNNLTLRGEACETLDANGGVTYGYNIALYSVSAPGETVYDLICESGLDSAVTRIVVDAVEREGNLPASIALAPASYEAEVDELIVVNPQISCWPEGTRLPEGTRVAYVAGRQFLEAVNQRDWFVSQSVSTFSFKEAGRYEADCVYSYSNISYTIPVTFYIRDGSGNVPVHGTRMTLSSATLQMVPGEESQLEAVFTPADVTDDRVTWTSLDTGVATVDASGRVRAVSNGATQITCRPSDAHCETAVCNVVVEDYLTVETGAASYTCYLEGGQVNQLSGAWLSEGTAMRLNRDGVKPEWTLTTLSGGSAVVAGAPDDDGAAIRVQTVSLEAAGTTRYRIECAAGDSRWTKDYAVVVNAAGVQAPERVTLATPEISMAVGEVRTIDFTPVCLPAGTSLPQNAVTTYVGIGGFYDALDRTAYERNGDSVTVAFKKAGCYLLARSYRLRNLDYTALCKISVGGGAGGSCDLLRASEQACVVWQGGRSGVVSHIAVYDSMVYERFGGEMQWRAERLSGDSVTAGLIPNADTAALYVADVERAGTDVWRVSCSFAGITEYVDITIDARAARKPIPDAIELTTQRLTGTIGDWLYLPLGVKCTPAGSALPETGDDFWSFEMMGGLAQDVSESRIDSGMLAVCFRESGYYTGTLRYAAGNVSFDVPLYFTISDEESQIDAPDRLKVWVLADSDTVYPEGETGVTIATAVLAENLNSYYAGTAPSYAMAKGAEWSLKVDSGNAVALAVRPHGANTADIVLSALNGAGEVSYTVSCRIDGKTYTGTGAVRSAGADEARPDVTLIKSRYQAVQGEPVWISRLIYQRSNGSVLQSAGEWDLGSALSAIGYTYETTDDNWKATFYRQGSYSTTVSVLVGNLRYELSLKITVVGDGVEEPLRVMKLPAALTAIEAEAFAGLTVQAVDLRGTKIRRIGSRAFGGCVDLEAIYIPGSVTSVADDAFYGCLNLTIHCAKGSDADRCATLNGFGVIYDVE